MSGIRLQNRVMVSKNGVRNSRNIARSGGVLAATLLTLGALGLGGVTPAFAQSNYSITRSDILRDTDSDGIGDTPVSGYGIFGLGETEPNNVTTEGQSSDAFAISNWTNVDLPGLISGTNGLYVAAVSSGFFYSQPDSLLGFVVGIPTGQSLPTPNTLSVRRNVVLQGAPLSTTNYDTFGLGWVNDNGWISFRTDSGSGGNTTSAPNTVAQVLATDHGYTLGTGALSIPPGSSMALLSRISATQSVPSIGDGNNLSFFTTFNRQVGAATTILDVTDPTYAPYANISLQGQAVQAYASPTDTRGSVTYNSKADIDVTNGAGMAAVFHYTGTNVVGVRVFKVKLDDSTGVVTVTKLDGTTPSTSVSETDTGDILPFTAVDGITPIGTNYFSRTSFAGTHQVAMNDNGDIATVVVIGTDPRGGLRKAYLFNKYNPSLNTYAGWEVVADSGTTGTGGPFVTDNPLSSVNELGVSSPGLDNDGNVYFSATHHITATVDPNTGQTVYNTSQAVYKATKTSGVWGSTELLRVGDDYTESRTDSLGTTTQDYKVLLIPVQVASSNLNNDNCRYNAPASIGPAAVQRVAGDRAGVVVQALVAPITGIDPDSGEQILGDAVQKYLIVSPGNTP